MAYRVDLSGIVALVHARRSRKASTCPPELDINHPKFSPRRYLQSGRDLNVVSSGGYATPLELAIEDQDWQVVRRMLDAGAIPRNEPPIRPVGATAYMDDVPASILEALVACGLKVDISNSAGYRPLHSAVNSSRPSVVETLLRLGANPNAGDFRGNTPVHAWAESTIYKFEGRHERTKHDQRLRILLRYGADINARNDFGWTPLQGAVMYYMWGVICAVGETPWDKGGHALSAIKLIRSGALAAGVIPKVPIRRSMRIPDRAPLLFAWPVGNGSLHRALIRAGASPHEPAANGLTPLKFHERHLARLDPSSRTSANQDSPDQLRRVIAFMSKPRVVGTRALNPRPLPFAASGRGRGTSARR